MPNINSFTPETHAFSQIAAPIANLPKRLWIKGELPVGRQPTVAIVGTRKPTPYGREVTYRLSYELAQRGIVILSGLALGVDGIAHQAALDAGGTTIAVLPTSLQSIHPATHRLLAEKIVRHGGALISEYSGEQRIFKTNFVARNRIVTALSDGVLITEAAVKSGTMSTVRFALEQGRPVMTVPGNITSPMSSGCNNLLKMGATPVTDVVDVLHELGLRDIGEQTSLLATTREQGVILKLLQDGYRESDELQQHSGLSAATFNQTLTMLEIEGKIRSLGANQWTIR